MKTVVSCSLRDGDRSRCVRLRYTQVVLSVTVAGCSALLSLRPSFSSCFSLHPAIIPLWQLCCHGNTKYQCCGRPRAPVLSSPGPCRGNKHTANEISLIKVAVL